VEPGAVTPVSLKSETGIDIAPEAFLDVLAPAFDRIERAIRHLRLRPIRAAWLQARRGWERPSRAAAGEEVTGRLCDVDD
jgi:BirA family biotin operon repressor/biotin-[acetyl-CoA-carboxylase] ligase